MKLIRINKGYTATFGQLPLPNGKTIFTLERPWLECAPVQLAPPNTTTRSGPWVQPPCGRKGVSCIPRGSYRLEKHSSDAHPDTFALTNPDLWVYHWDSEVPPDQKGFARTAVLIHPANYPEELRGCIAPGLRYLTSTSEVTNSREAFGMLLPYLRAGDTFEIE